MVRRKRQNRGKLDMANHVHVGVVARLVDRAFDDPAMSSGLFVMALTAMAIVSNAMFLQPSRHPEPLFQSGGSDETNLTAGQIEVAIAPEAPVPHPRQRQPSAPEPVAAVAASAPPTPVTRPLPVAEPDDEQTVLVAAVQRELARLGLYAGAIDGISGSRTRAAISQYQTASRLTVTGLPSAELLKLITEPPAAESIGQAAAPSESTTVDLATLERASIAAMEADRLRRIQAALNKIGYGPLDVDGQVGPSTTNAIHRFELDQGMEVRGAANDQLISRLVAIGALEAT